MSVSCPLSRPTPQKAADTPEPPVGLDRWGKIAVIAPNCHIAELYKRQYKDMPWMKVIWPGICIAGYRFQLVLISSDTLSDIERGAPQSHRDWWNEQVRCRLAFNGQIIVTP